MVAGLCYSRLGGYYYGIRLLRKSVELIPEKVEYKLTLCYAMTRYGNFYQALEILEQILSSENLSSKMNENATRVKSVIDNIINAELKEKNITKEVYLKGNKLF